jgi:hypothetical protein
MVLDVAPQDVTEVYRLRGRLVGRVIGFARVDGQDLDFWTHRGPRVLDALCQLGFPVNGAIKRPTKVWSGQP